MLPIRSLCVLLLATSLIAAQIKTNGRESQSSINYTLEHTNHEITPIARPPDPIPDQLNLIQLDDKLDKPPQPNNSNQLAPSPTEPFGSNQTNDTTIFNHRTPIVRPPSPIPIPIPGQPNLMQQNNGLNKPPAPNNQLAPTTVDTDQSIQNTIDTNTNGISTPPDERQYAVVVDCGSSGTRAAIYHWPANETAKLEPLRNATTGEPISWRIKPGLASVRTNPDSASDYMRPIMQFASAHVPKSSQAKTAVHIWGTAGMRMLSDLEQHLILEDIARDVANEFDFKTIKTQVITGTDEGAYRWLSANEAATRLGANFDQYQQPIQFIIQDRHRRRFGVLEMGGASAQVTYELTPRLEDSIRPFLPPGEPLEVFRAARRRFRLARPQQIRSADDANNSSRSQRGKVAVSSGDDGNKLDYNLLSVSFAGFGSDVARSWSVDLLVSESLRQHRACSARFYWPQITLVVDDPCLAHGVEEKLIKPLELISSAYGSSAWSSSKTIGFDLKPGDATFTVRLIGQGNFVACRMLLFRMVFMAKQEKTNCQWQRTSGGATTKQPSTPTPIKPCESALIGTNFVPWSRLQFLGLGELYYTSRGGGSMMDMMQGGSSGADSNFNWLMLQLKALRICATPVYEQPKTNVNHYNYQTATNQTTGEQQRTNLQCFKATWVLTWLQTVLLMPASTLISDLQTVNNLNGNQLDWTRGALMTQINSIN